MNHQPFRTPPQWWSPRMSQFWMRFWRPMRRHRGYLEHGLVDVDVLGLDHVEQARRDGHSVLITPNHPTHADPFVLLEAADQLGSGLYFMTAWQVFARQHHVGRRVLRQHGCFSINREGNDLRAIRQAIRVLEQAEEPLVIFPEGEVFHLNDRVTPFRRGAATIAHRAARCSGRSVAIVPCGVKFFYAEDPTPALLSAMDRLEKALHWEPGVQLPLVKRIRRFAEALVAAKEAEYLGQTQRGGLQQRISRLTSVILGRLEDRYQVRAPRPYVPERVKQLRYRAIALIESAAIDPDRKAQCERDLNDLFFVIQLYSYPVDYLAGRASVERLAETLDKLEEDVFHAHRAHLRGPRSAVVAFDEPLVIQPDAAQHESNLGLTERMEQRVQEILDDINRLYGDESQVEPQPRLPLLPGQPMVPEPTVA